LACAERRDTAMEHAAAERKRRRLMWVIGQSGAAEDANFSDRLDGH
jgi:hypothetical protein